MIYFKLPFDERLLSADEKNIKNAVNFYSYNGSEHISFHGNIVEVNFEEFAHTSITNEDLIKDPTNSTAETKEEYCQTLQEVIEVIK